MHFTALNRNPPTESTPPPTRPSRWQGRSRSVAVGLFAADATSAGEGVQRPGQGRGIDPDGGPDLCQLGMASILATTASWSSSPDRRSRPRDEESDGIRTGTNVAGRECRQHKDRQRSGIWLGAVVDTRSIRRHHRGRRPTPGSRRDFESERQQHDHSHGQLRGF